MITKWRLSNFKAVYEPTELNLKPLTVFVGPNSSGKSTFIQSILLIAQTINNPVYSKAVILNGNIVRLGTYDDLASKENIPLKAISIGFTLEPHRHSSHSSRDTALLVWQNPRYARRIGQDLKLINCDISFSALAEPFTKDILQLKLQPCLTRAEISVVTSDTGESVQLKIIRSSKTQEQRSADLGISLANLSAREASALEYEVIEPKQIPTSPRWFRAPRHKEMPIGCKVSHFLPTVLSIPYNSVEEHARLLVNGFFTPEVEVNLDESDEPFLSAPFLNRLYDIVKPLSQPGALESRSQGQLYPGPSGRRTSPILMSRLRRIRETIKELEGSFTADKLLKLIRLIGKERLAPALNPELENELVRLSRGDQEERRILRSVQIPDNISEGNKYIQYYFSEMFKYLGPLRDEPKAVYPLQGSTDPADVGLKGEYTAAVLHLHKDTIVRYIPPATFLQPGAPMVSEEVALQKAVLDWLQYMAIAHKIQTADQGNFGHALQVAPGSDGELHNLTHVGVGVSQVLPILVMSLLADPGSLLIFEQPEIHLNPKVQTRLADFLLSLSLMNKQCIVETHSEYLINRLRFRSADDQTDTFSKKMVVYYVENLEGHSSYRPVNINEYGAISDWPSGFFDESPREAEQILRAAMKKRKQLKKES